MSTEIYVKSSGGGNGLLSALPWTANHTALTGNPYLVGTLVYDGGNIYKCLITNDSIPTWNPFFWYDLGPGFILAQEKPDWNATSGDSEILNKPTLTSGTVTSVELTSGTGISLSGTNPITSSGIINITNSAPDQIVSLTPGSGMDITGSYPDFTIAYNGAVPASRLQHNVKYGEAITKGQAVYVSSADGTNIVVSKASNTTEATSSKTIGLVIATGSTNYQGIVVTEGLLAGLDTTGASAAGDPVWLGINGNLIYGLVSKPVAPAHLVFIGIVTRRNVNNGEIFVKVQNGFELQELHNVLISGLTNNNLLTYESSSQLWKNKSLGTVIGGSASQYLRGDGTIASFPDISGGGGGQVYYLNGSVSQGTISGTAYKQLSTGAIIGGAGVDFTSGTVDGVAFASFITDVGKPTQETIPAGVWIFQCYLSASSTNTCEVYATVEVYNGSTFTVLSTSLHEVLTGNNNIDLYTFTCAVPEYNPLTPTDRIAIRFYPTNLGGSKTITLHTEASHLSSIQSTFTTGLASLDGLTAAAQYLQVGTTGTDFAITTSGADTHVFNLPTATAINRGALSSGDWTTFNSKIGGSGTLSYVPRYTASGTIGNSLIQDNSSTVGIGGLLATSQFYITQNALQYGLYSTNGYATGVTYGGSFRSTAGKAATNVGAEGVASGSTGLNTGISGIANSVGAAKNYGGSFVAGFGSNNYAVRLLDGSEGSGKFLKDVTGSGEARWSNITTADISGILTGSGTAGYMTRFAASTILGDSVIQDNGTTLGIGIAPSAGYKLFINAIGTNVGISVNADNVGIYGIADNTDGVTTPIGVYGNGTYSGGGVPPPISIGGYFAANNCSSNYSLQLQDSTEGVGKFLKSVTSDGKANWANITVADTGLTLTTTGTSGAATLVGNTLNIPQYSGGGGSVTLSQVLINGNSAGTTDINMNNNDITSIATVSANNGPAVQMINMTNAVNMLLMYNS